MKKNKNIFNFLKLNALINYMKKYGLAIYDLNQFPENRAINVILCHSLKEMRHHTYKYRKSSILLPYEMTLIE